jgi:signal transduction histidine kinase
MKGRRIGLRREVLILLPASLLLLAGLSTFTLFAHRSALALLAEERREAAADLAASVAAALAGAPAPSPGALRRLAPGASAVTLLDAGGEVLAATGEPAATAPLAPAAGLPLDRPLGLGLDARLPEGVAGFAPLAGPEGRRFVRVDLPAGALAGGLRAARVLTVVVLAVNGALILLVLAFLRHLLEPYEALLARARAAGEPAGAEGDEVEFLVATFERALAAMAGAEARTADDDIAALERTLAGSLQSGLLLLDQGGEVLALNPVGARLLAVPPPEPGRPLGEVLAGHPELLALLTEAVAGGRELQRRECAVRRGGETLTLGLSAHPLRRGDGGVRGYLVLFADLTEARRQADEGRLAESLGRLGEMAGGVAHELRNGLATLRGYLTLIERRPDEEAIADFLSEMRREADHLERVLDDFLAFARPGTARTEEISLPVLLRRAAADPALDGIGVELAGAAGEEPRLAGDPQLLERALRNLLRNAAQAEREAGRSGPLNASVESGPGGVELVIEDRGPGLPAEVRQRLFHPFVTGRAGGVGLGLALAHRIVVLHGGTIRLEDRPGGGTRVRIHFPADTVVTTGNRTAADTPSPPASA